MNISFAFVMIIILLFPEAGLSQKKNEYYFIGSDRPSDKNALICSIDDDGNYHIHNENDLNSLESPVDLKIYKGVLYGLCEKGGKYNFGGLFKYDLKSKVFTKLTDFDNELLANAVGITVEDDHIFIISWRGIRGFGGVHSYSLVNSTLKKMINFKDHEEFGGHFNPGLLPVGRFQITENEILGLTMFGGGLCIDHINQISYPKFGTIYTLNRSDNSYEIKHIFECVNSLGRYPLGSFLDVNGDFFFPMDRSILKYNSKSNVVQKIADFNGQIKGDIFLLNQRIWGITISEAREGYGGIFSINPDGTNFRYDYSFEDQVLEPHGYSLGAASLETQKFTYSINSDGIDLYGVINSDFGSSSIFCYDISEDTFGIIKEFEAELDDRLEFEGDDIVFSSKEAAGLLMRLNKSNSQTEILHRFLDFTVSPYPHLEFYNGYIYFISPRVGKNYPMKLNRFNTLNKTLTSIYEFDDEFLNDNNKLFIENERIRGFISSKERKDQMGIFEFNLTTGIFSVLKWIDKQHKDNKEMFLQERETIIEGDKIYYHFRDIVALINNYSIINEYDITEDKERVLIDFNNKKGYVPWDIRNLLFDDGFLYGFGANSYSFKFDLKAKLIVNEHIDKYGINNSIKGKKYILSSSGDRLLFINNDLDSVNQIRIPALNNYSNRQILSIQNLGSDIYFPAAHWRFGGDTISTSLLHVNENDTTSIRTILKYNNFEHPRIISNLAISRLTEDGGNSDKNFVVFPNPSQGIVRFINSSEAELQEVGIYSLNGSKLKEFSKANYRSQIDLGDLSRGIYIIRFMTDHFAESQKIIIQ